MRWVLSLFTLLALFVAGLFAPDRPPPARAGRVTVAPLPVARTEAEIAGVTRRAPTWSETRTREAYRSEIPAEQAVQIALRRGEEIRAAREAANTPTLRAADAVVVSVAVAVPEPVAAPEPAAQELAALPVPDAAAGRRVTADRVNLRRGPGTDTPVVGQASAGEMLVPLSDAGGDWIEVRLPSGETAWIFARFLAPAEG